MSSNITINITNLRVANTAPMRTDDLTNLLQLVTSGKVDLSQVLSTPTSSVAAPIVATVAQSPTSHLTEDAQTMSDVDRADPVEPVVKQAALIALSSAPAGTCLAVAEPDATPSAIATEQLDLSPDEIRSANADLDAALAAISVEVLDSADNACLVATEPDAAPSTTARESSTTSGAPLELPSPIASTPAIATSLALNPLGEPASTTAPLDLSSVNLPIASSTSDDGAVSRAPIGDDDEIAVIVLNPIVSTASSASSAVLISTPPASTSSAVAVVASSTTTVESAATAQIGEQLRVPKDTSTVPQSLAQYVSHEYAVNGVELGFCTIVRGKSNIKVRYSAENVMGVYLWALDCFVLLKSYKNRRVPPHITRGTLYDRSVARLAPYANLAAFMTSIGGLDLAERTFASATAMVSTAADNAILLTGAGYPSEDDEPVPNDVLQRIEAIRNHVRMTPELNHQERHFDVVMPNDDVKRVTLPQAYPTGDKHRAMGTGSLPATITRGASPNDIDALQSRKPHKEGPYPSMHVQSCGMPAWANTSASLLSAYVNGKWMSWDENPNSGPQTWTNTIGKALRSKQYDPMDSIARAYVYNAVRITEVKMTNGNASTSSAPTTAAKGKSAPKAKTPRKASTSAVSTTTATAENKTPTPSAPKAKAPSKKRKAESTSAPKAKTPSKVESTSASRKRSAPETGTASDSDSADTSTADTKRRKTAEKVASAAIVKLQTDLPATAANLTASLSAASDPASVGVALANLDTVAVSHLARGSQPTIATSSHTRPIITIDDDDDNDDVVLAESEQQTHLYVPITIDSALLAIFQRLVNDATVTPLVKALLESQLTLRAFIAAGVSGLTSIRVRVDYIEQSSVGAIAALNGSKAAGDIATFQGIMDGVTMAFGSLITCRGLPERLTPRLVFSTAYTSSNLDGMTALFRMCGVSRAEAIDYMKRMSGGDAVATPAAAPSTDNSPVAEAMHEDDAKHDDEPLVPATPAVAPVEPAAVAPVNDVSSVDVPLASAEPVRVEQVAPVEHTTSNCERDWNDVIGEADNESVQDWLAINNNILSFDETLAGVIDFDDMCANPEPLDNDEFSKLGVSPRAIFGYMNAFHD